MSRFGSIFLYTAAGAILTAGLIVILQPVPSLSQDNPALTATLNAILAKLDRMDKKSDSINARLGQVSGNVTRVRGDVDRLYKRSTSRIPYTVPDPHGDRPDPLRP